MIKLQVIGNVGQDARVNEVNGRRSINFSVAHNHKFKDANGTEVEQTVWVNCSYWKSESQSTEIAKYLTRGTQIYLEGIPEVKTYKNKEGQTVASLNLSVRDLQLLGARKAEGDQATQPEGSENSAPGSGPADDLPF